MMQEVIKQILALAENLADAQHAIDELKQYGIYVRLEVVDNEICFEKVEVH